MMHRRRNDSGQHTEDATARRSGQEDRMSHRTRATIHTVVLVVSFLLIVGLFGPPIAADIVVWPARTCTVENPHGPALTVRRSMITGAAQWRVPDSPNFADAGRWLASGAVTEQFVRADRFRGAYRGSGSTRSFSANGYNSGPFDLHAMFIEIEHDEGEARRYFAIADSHLGITPLPPELNAAIEAVLGVSVAPRIPAFSAGTVTAQSVEADNTMEAWTVLSSLVSLRIPAHVCR